MNASGLLWDDGTLASLFLYLFWGGWFATLAGWAICLFIGLARGRRRAAVRCALLGLLPGLYILVLVLLARSGGGPPASNIAFLSVMAGMLVAILACPVAAAVTAWRGARATRCGPGSTR